MLQWQQGNAALVVETVINNEYCLQEPITSIGYSSSNRNKMNLHFVSIEFSMDHMKDPFCYDQNYGS